MFYFVCVLVVEAIVIAASIVVYGRAHNLDKGYVVILLIMSAGVSVPLAYNVWAALYDTNTNDAGYRQANGWLILVNFIVLLAHMYGGYLWDSRHEPKKPLNSTISH